MAVFGMGKPRCQQCGAELAEGSRFCARCGAPSSRGSIACPACGAQVPADSTFCPNCRQQLQGTPPTVSGQIWRKGPDDFAARVEVDDIAGFFKKELVIETGTRAIVLVDGKNDAGEVGPGRYTLDTATAHIPLLGRAKAVTAILVDAGDVSLQFTVPDLFTTDPIRISLDCRLAARISDPGRFLVNLMKGQRAVALSQLRSYLFDEIQNAAAEAVGRHSVAELNSNLALKEELAAHIEGHLTETLGRLGLKFDRVAALNFRCARWDEQRQAREEVFLQISKEEAELEGKRRMADVVDQKELLAIAAETRQVSYHEQRAQLWARMRRSVSSDRMDEVRGEEEFAHFMRGLDRQKLLEEGELEDLKREFREKGEDHDQLRAHFLAKSRLEQDYELKAIDLAKRKDLTLEEQTLEQEVERRRTQQEVALQEQRLLADIQARKQTATADAELQDLRRQQQGADVDQAMGWMLRLKEMQAQERQGKIKDALEVRRTQLELQLTGERQRLDMELQRFREERAAELERIRTISQLSTEALIAVSGTEQGRMLAELKRTETLKGMTEEQILALAAEKAPEVAKAFAEKYRNLPAVEQKALYERLIETEKGSRAEQAQMSRDMMATFERMFQKAVETQRDTATAFARGQGPTVVFPPSGGSPSTVSGGTVTGGGAADAAARSVVCRNCGAESPAGTRFCKNCGQEFYQVPGRA